LQRVGCLYYWKTDSLAKNHQNTNSRNKKNKTVRNLNFNKVTTKYQHQQNSCVYRETQPVKIPICIHECPKYSDRLLRGFLLSFRGIARMVPQNGQDRSYVPSISCCVSSDLLTLHSIVEKTFIVQGKKVNQSRYRPGQAQRVQGS